MVDISKIERDLQEYDVRIQSLIGAFNQRAARPDDKEWIKDYLRHMADIDQYTRVYAAARHCEGKDIDQVTHDYKLLADFAGDEQERSFFKDFFPRWQAVDRQCTAQLKELLRSREWIVISEFGEEADSNAWLIAQHADLDPEFQKQVLSVLERLYPVGETKPGNYAYLFDRVAVSHYDENQRRPQRYGTQGADFPVEDPAHLDQRRKKLGLKP